MQKTLRRRLAILLSVAVVMSTAAPVYADAQPETAVEQESGGGANTTAAAAEDTDKEGKGETGKETTESAEEETQGETEQSTEAETTGDDEESIEESTEAESTEAETTGGDEESTEESTEETAEGETQEETEQSTEEGTEAEAIGDDEESTEESAEAEIVEAETEAEKLSVFALRASIRSTTPSDASPSDAVVEVTKLTATPGNVTVEKDKTKTVTITATTSPANATELGEDIKLELTVASSSVASAEVTASPPNAEDGSAEWTVKISGAGVGTTTVTAKCGEKKAEIGVEVTEAGGTDTSGGDDDQSKIELQATPSNVSISVNAPATVTVTASPGNALNGKTLTATSSNAQIATATVQSGNSTVLITAGAQTGTATITIGCDGADPVTVNVTVTEGGENPEPSPAASEVTIASPSVAVYAGKTKDVVVVASWADASPGVLGNLEWKVKTGDSAAVNLPDKATQLSNGQEKSFTFTGNNVSEKKTVTLTVTLTGSQIEKKTADLEVTVYPAPSLTLNPVSTSIIQGGNTELTAKITGSDLSDSPLTLSGGTIEVPAGLSSDSNSLGSGQSKTIKIYSSPADAEPKTYSVVVKKDIKDYGEISGTASVTVVAKKPEGEMNVLPTDKFEASPGNAAEEANSSAVGNVQDDLDKLPEDKQNEVKEEIKKEINQKVSDIYTEVEQSLATPLDASIAIDVPEDALDVTSGEDTVRLEKKVTDIGVSPDVTVDASDPSNPATEVEVYISTITMDIKFMKATGSDVVKVKPGNTKVISIPIVVPDSVWEEAATVKIKHTHDGRTENSSAKIEKNNGIRYFFLKTTNFSEFEFTFDTPLTKTTPSVKPDNTPSTNPTYRPSYGGGSSGGGGGSSSRSGRSANAGITTSDPKKGMVNSIKGIITGPNNTKKSGYSSWYQQTDGSWKFQYANGSMAAGQMLKDAAGKSYEQPAWELINGAWYAFGADGVADSGMIYDTALGGWFYVDINTGMKTGWHQMDQKWRYFQTVSDGYKGRMLVNTVTPDKYRVDKDGIWDGKGKVD